MLDMDLGTIGFIVNGVDKGVAIQNEELKSGEYFITLNVYEQNGKIIMTIPLIKEEVKPKDPSKDSILQILEIGDKDFQ